MPVTLPVTRHRPAHPGRENGQRGEQQQRDGCGERIDSTHLFDANRPFAIPLQITSATVYLSASVYTESQISVKRDTLKDRKPDVWRSVYSF
jgi:hypothetical protein